jgi:ssRNA-specific RNase YbeY (16S rRNA maturation enzyme)
LHLCGFKDKEPAEEARMREEENKAISSLEKPLKK